MSEMNTDKGPELCSGDLSEVKGHQVLQVFVQILFGETLEEFTSCGSVDLTNAAYQFILAHT
jgi:hypothetical protein